MISDMRTSMFQKTVFRFLFVCQLLVNSVNSHGLAHTIKLMEMGYQVCGHQHEPPAVNKKCCYNKELSKFYYEDLSICCNGEVYDKFDPSNIIRICCNDVVINGDDFICCEGHKHQIPLGHTHQEVGCCGNKSLTKDEMCCRGSKINTKQVYSDDIGCCNGTPFNKLTNWCQGTEIMDLYKERCGNSIIQLRTHSCCNGVKTDYPVYKKNNILQKDENRACCGERSYDSSKNKCCPNYETIIPRDPVLHCCGTDYFNATSELCCDRKVYTKQYGKDSLCCGQEVINITQKDCCYGQSYDRDTSKCCLGHSYGKVMSINDLCCDGEEVTEDSLCCNSIELIKKSHPSHNRCCLKDLRSGGVSYNNDEQICKDGILLTKRPDGKAFCGSEPYDPANFICCNNQLTPITDGTKMACCGFKTINQNKQKCCKEYVIDFPTDDSICCLNEVFLGCHYNDESCSCTKKCNNELYNPNSEICCGESLYQKSNVNECCGSLPIYNNHTCCNGVRYNGKRECCGRRVLRGGETCCGDFVVQKISRKSQKCCPNLLYGAGQSIPYDPLFSRCHERSGNVISKARKIYTPECRLSNVYKRNDLYGWIPAACNSRYGFLGTITKIVSKWNKRTGKGYQTVTLTDVRNLKRRKYGWKTLKFRTEYTKQKKCFSRLKRLKNVKVALFTSASFESGSSFDFVDQKISRNDVQYSTNEFYVVKANRHFRHSFYSLKHSHFCQFRYQYKYMSLIR